MTDANPSSIEMNPTGSASEQTPTVDPPANVTDEMVTNHPLFKTLKEEHSAAEREKERYKGRLEKVQKGFSDEPEVPVKTKEETPYVTKDELWELKNEKDVSLYGDDEYKADIQDGIPKDYALKNAKLRFQSNPDKVRLQRQQEMSSGSAMGVRDLGSDEFTPTEQEGIAKGLYTKETVLKHRELKKARG